jgi:hypothetical protein
MYPYGYEVAKAQLLWKRKEQWASEDGLCDPRGTWFGAAFAWRRTSQAEEFWKERLSERGSDSCRVDHAVASKCRARIGSVRGRVSAQVHRRYWAVPSAR